MPKMDDTGDTTYTDISEEVDKLEANRVKGSTHNCKEAGCDVGPDGAPVVPA